MSKKDIKEIGEHIRRIAGVQPVVMSGKVQEVQEDDGTCSVLLSIDDEATEGVLLTSVTGNANGVVILPKAESQVWVAEIDGPGKWGIVKYGEIEKVTVKMGGTPEIVVTEGEIVMNGGGLGGLTKTQVLKTELDKVKDFLTHLKTVIGGSPIPEPGSGSPSALQAALSAAIASDQVPSFENIENDKVKH